MSIAPHFAIEIMKFDRIKTNEISNQCTVTLFKHVFDRLYGIVVFEYIFLKYSLMIKRVSFMYSKISSIFFRNS